MMTLLVALSTIGCTGGVSSQLTQRGFVHGRHSLRVSYAQGYRFAGPGWRVDNLQSTALGNVRQKHGELYEAQILVDWNNDGVTNSREGAPRYELRLTHSRTSGLIWLSHIVLPRRFRDSDLHTLARLYVESVAGAGIVVTDVGVSQERRYATRVIREEAGSVDGLEALYVAFEVANVDQLALSQDARWRRVEVMLIRSGHLWSSARSSFGVLGTVLVAGHQNDPDVFEQTSIDFRRFVSSIDFRHDELAAAHAAVARCTTRNAARIYFARATRRFQSPDLTLEEIQCVRSSLPRDLQTGFLYRRSPAP